MEQKMTQKYLMQIQDERSRLPDGMFERTCLPRWEYKLKNYPLVSWLSEESRELLRQALTAPMENGTILSVQSVEQ